ncbi:MAG TPA: hypothetical protein VFF27_05420, partial [Bacteroidia bacterium]|nr:hypothetical protein [Bacteroidia bacterium]
ARESQEEVSDNVRLNLGLGAGLDYGGFGARLTLMTSEKFGIFGAVGYNLVGAGFNGGINYKFSPGKRTCPVIGAMYGYNGVIKIVDGVEASKTYYGPSFSMGLEVKSKKKINNNFWSFALLIPIRPSEFDADINRLKNSGYDVSEPLPIAFSIGLHFGMK